ncbi:sugar O-acetyltransferase [Aeromonas hydrophila]|uniref:sugar O-acetyltransferase n=1 Tax=Aeromonas hydrophila TaxID=644 RepID=UPI001A928B67|nr:sugar O-acetyltransferase [Aeromonas hydrophila]MBO0406013.1 sugar O-acetyltransferase [Aeromonas hydrophila]
MTEYDKMLASQPYNCMAPELDLLRRETARLYRRLNRSDEEDEQLALLQQIVGELAQGAFICPPLYCTYGCHIYLGERSYINMGATLLDNAPIRIGAEVMIGPNVQIYTAAHALDADERIQGVETALPVTIEDRVWIGGGAILLPGVTIGREAVVGAGAVVTKDVPAGARVVGNPARLLPVKD